MIFALEDCKNDNKREFIELTFIIFMQTLKVQASAFPFRQVPR